MATHAAIRVMREPSIDCSQKGTARMRRFGHHCTGGDAADRGADADVPKPQAAIERWRPCQPTPDW